MIYSDFAIEQLKNLLIETSMKNSTPKKYAGTMLEAYEVICQLQKGSLQPVKGDEEDGRHSRYAERNIARNAYSTGFAGLCDRRCR